MIKGDQKNRVFIDLTWFLVENIEPLFELTNLYLTDHHSPPPYSLIEKSLLTVIIELEILRRNKLLKSQVKTTSSVLYYVSK